MVLFTFILRGDVLAPHSRALEIGESLHCVRVICAEDSSVGSHRILDYCNGLYDISSGRPRIAVEGLRVILSHESRVSVRGTEEAAEAALKGQGLGLAKAVRKSLEAKADEL